jgi:hypothetical protein
MARMVLEGTLPARPYLGLNRSGDYGRGEASCERGAVSRAILALLLPLLCISLLGMPLLVRIRLLGRAVRAVIPIRSNLLVRCGSRIVGIILIPSMGRPINLLLILILLRAILLLCGLRRALHWLDLSGMSRCLRLFLN